MLSNPRLLPAERLDLEDWNALIEAIRTDQKYETREFWAPTQFILKGFAVSGLGGPSPASVNLTDATLINANNTGDFSWFVAPVGASPISVTLTPGQRNFLELQIGSETGTPLSRAFWDPSANGGLGQEFSQTVDTMTSLNITVNVLSGGFSGSTNTIPLAVVDTDGSNNILGILDWRKLFGRLGVPGDAGAGFSWASQLEPELTLSLSGVTGSFQVGETVNFSSGATAVVSTGGGGPSIGVILLSDLNLASGDTVTGATSSASGTLDTFSDSFTGADKSLANLRDILSAIMNEVRALKGTNFWFSSNFGSTIGILKLLNSVVAPISSGAKVAWDGSALSITDTNGSPLSTDTIAKIRRFGTNQQLALKRQDGQDSTTTLAIADGEVLFVHAPTSGNVDYSGAGSGSTNYQVVAISAFENLDETYWLAYREGSKLMFRGVGELKSGESADIGDNVPQNLLDIIGIADEETPPAYSSDIRGVAAESLVARLGTLTDAVGDEQEDRSGYLRSDDTVSWSGTQLTFTEDLVLEFVNTKNGTIHKHKVLAANSPISIADGESIWVLIDRTNTNETLTYNNSGSLAIPAQTQANKEVFVLFRRVDGLGVQYLHIPFHKQIISPGQTVHLGGGASNMTEGIPNVSVTSESELTAAIASLPSGGVILISSPFSIASDITVTSKILIQGRLGAAVLTVATGGRLILDDEARIRDLELANSKTSGELVLASGNKTAVETCKFSLNSADSVTGVKWTGSMNDVRFTIFSGVVGGSAVAIEAFSGSDNEDFYNKFE